MVSDAGCRVGGSDKSKVQGPIENLLERLQEVSKQSGEVKGYTEELISRFLGTLPCSDDCSPPCRDTDSLMSKMVDLLDNISNNIRDTRNAVNRMD